MDDGEPKKLTTSSRNTRHLRYGSFGNATFREARHEWRFLRSDADYSTLELELTTAQRFLLADDSWCFNDPDTQTRHIPRSIERKGRSHNDKALLQYCTSGSETILHPSQGRGVCLVSGYAPARNPHRSTQWIPLIASARGPASNLLRLNLITNQPTSQQEDSGLFSVDDLPQISPNFAEVKLPALSSILQVQMITNFDNAQSLIGVRQATATTLLLHQFEDRSNHTSSPTASNGLVVKPILSIPVSRTGGQSHAAFALCSDGRHHRLGIIDTRGNWSVWHIRGQKHVSNRFLSSARLEYFGKLFAWQGRRRPAHIEPFFDGWHHILWLHRQRSAEKILLLCNRQVVRIFDALGQPLGDIDLHLRLGSDEWILDVQRLYQHSQVFVILTTSRLLVLSLMHGKRPSRLLCSWDHFHGTTDLKFKMCIIEFPYDIRILLYTTQSPAIISCAFYFYSKEDGLIISASDPTDLRLPAALSNIYGEISEITFLFVRQGAAIMDELGKPSFIKMVALLDDGTLFETLYPYNHPNGFELDPAEHLVLRIPEVAKDRYKSSRSVDDDADMYDFLVPDADNDSRQLVVSTQRTRQPLTVDGHTATSLSENWSSLLDRGTSHRNDATVLGDYVPYIIELVQSTTSACLLHALLPQAQADDVDATSRALSRVNATLSTRLTHIDRRGPTSLLDHHTVLFQKHVTPLSEEVSDHGRVILERIVRSAAADKMLASQVVSGDSRSTAVFSDRELDTEARAEASAESPIPRVSRLESLLAPIRRYTQVETLAPSNMESQAVSAMLTHLPENISADPDDYSYQNAELSHALSRKELASQNMDEQSKQRAEKRAEVQRRRLEKQKRERERIELEKALLPNVLMSSELPVRTTSSQPGFSSQSTVIPDVMTQSDRGPFGGRQRGKDRTKPTRPRKAGF